MSPSRGGLDAFQPQAFELAEIPAGSDPGDYYRLLTETYEPLGFMTKEILPTAESRRFRISHRGKVVAIFRLTAVDEAASPFFDYVPGARGRRLAEVNNVIVAADFRATILLGYLLYHSALIAHDNGFDFVVGITRHQTLRFFVDFGVIPVDHPPLHLLGKEHLLDFVIYYETRSPQSVAYMHERARRYFHQQYVLKTIHEKYVRGVATPALVPLEPAGTAWAAAA